MSRSVSVLAFLVFAYAAVPSCLCSLVTTCQTDADCSNTQRCVVHYNYASSANCESAKYCISVSKTSCSCKAGYTCRLKDCPASPYECLIIENQDTRCGGSQAPTCLSTQICGYKLTGLVCIKCPCYGTHKAVCVTRKSTTSCGANSIVTVDQKGGYTCNGCASAVSVLTG
uniref:Putative cysteine rich secreted protein n=1 Tax=Amblyomma triste TaxID=251400 RepID=A0A023GCK2_AMBTT